MMMYVISSPPSSTSHQPGTAAVSVVGLFLFLRPPGGHVARRLRGAARSAVGARQRRKAAVRSSSKNAGRLAAAAATMCSLAAARRAGCAGCPCWRVLLAADKDIFCGGVAPLPKVIFVTPAGGGIARAAGATATSGGGAAGGGGAGLEAAAGPVPPACWQQAGNRIHRRKQHHHRITTPKKCVACYSCPRRLARIGARTSFEARRQSVDERLADRR